MPADERAAALAGIWLASNAFYTDAVRIANHPFIEFAGLMNKCIKACEQAHAQGIDFTDCNQHPGRVLPLHAASRDCINEKLACIFSGAKVLDVAANESIYPA